MIISSILLSSIESAFNRYLQYDPYAVKKMARLQDKVILLHITGLDITLYFLPHTKGISLFNQYSGAVDTTIQAPPITLMRLSVAEDAETFFINSNASISGNIGIGTHFSHILKDVDIQWEDWLSQWVGDLIAHQSATVAHNVKGWIDDTNHAMRMNTGEYLTEESRLTPHELELSHYLDEVDQLNADTERLNARVHRLEKTLKNNKKN